MKKPKKILIGFFAILILISVIRSIINPDKATTPVNDVNTTDFSTNNTQPITQIPESDIATSEGTETESETEIIFDFSNCDTSYEEINFEGLSAKHGELLSVIYSDGTVIVKTKIEPSMTNNLTIEQNYFTVADLVKNHGFNTCEKLSYWAVANMSDGEEAKCISFDLSKEILTELYNGNIIENQLGNYATDLWILPSLLN